MSFEFLDKIQFSVDASIKEVMNSFSDTAALSQGIGFGNHSGTSY